MVVKANTEEYEIVDGFHRHELGKGKAALKRRLKGYLPITCLDRERHERMAATIRHNRARGRHQIHAMSEIVRELSLLGWDESKIGQELGMDADEVLRLKQINGLQELLQTVDSPERGRLNNYSLHRRSAAAGSVDSCLAKHKRIS